jgi:sugar/nucleoside kinase (ribokinase family)
MQLGAFAERISAIGQDPPRDEILTVVEDKGVNTQFATGARIGLPTGTVLVTVDANGNATCELGSAGRLRRDPGSSGSLDAVAQARAHIFDSLPGRSPYDLDQLDRLLAIGGPAFWERGHHPSSPRRIR